MLDGGQARCAHREAWCARRKAWSPGPEGREEGLDPRGPLAKCRREIVGARIGERIVRALETPQLDLVSACPDARELHRSAEAQRVAAEALHRVVRGLSGRDQERPVARLREQQLARGLTRRARAKGGRLPR